MSKLKIGVDPGNHKGKVVGPFGFDAFKTNICDWFERDVEETFGPDDMEFEIDGRKGFAGSIAAFEDDFGGVGMFGDSKAHEDGKVRVLLALHRYIKRYCPDLNEVYVVTGQPIKSHKPGEKEKIKQMLLGRHDFKVNGDHQTIFIEGVEVAPEGGGAFWSNPIGGSCKILDIGSGTVNAIAIQDKKIINTASGTFNFGMETVKNKDDLAGIARGIIRNTTKLKWQKSDPIFVCGGIAEQIAPFIKEHYEKTNILRPQYKYHNGFKLLHPVYANAVGFYQIAKGVFN